MASKIIPEQWKEWIDHNFDRLSDKKEMIRLLIEEGKFSTHDIDEYLLDAKVSHGHYAKFIETIQTDFDDQIQMDLNLKNLKKFLTIEQQKTSPEIILNRIKMQLISLDKSCSDFKIRAQKIAFFNALDALIINDGYEFPYPDPMEFEFFPVRNNLCDSYNDDLKNFEKQKIANASLYPISKINQNILYIIKNDNGSLVNLGKGTYGKLYQGFYQNELVAIKHTSIDKFEFELRWKCISIYYRQSLAVLEKTFDNVVSMNEIFFYQEKSVFDDGRNCSIIALYPLCRNSFLDVVKEESILNDYQSFKPLKKLLKSMNKLHQNNICINDLNSSNILFDFFDNVFFNDFDFWLPKKISNMRSIYIQEVSITDVCCGLSEINFIEDGDLSMILPDKSDIWCFGAVILDGFGYFDKKAELSWKKTNMQKYVKIGRSSSIFKEKLTELKICAEDLVKFVKEDLDKKIDNESDELRKKFLKDVKEVLLACLQLNSQNRCSAEELLNYNLFLTVN